jgi:hypothetical protein
MNLIDYINDTDWHTPEALASLFKWATSPEIETSGEGRRQLGYLDGYEGQAAASRNEDYLKGWEQGRAMAAVAFDAGGD